MGCSVTIGFIYPAYQSYKALEGKRSDDAAEWLTYWVIFSLFTVFESIADWFISWIPFYYIFKLVLLLWLLLPQFKVGTQRSIGSLQISSLWSLLLTRAYLSSGSQQGVPPRTSALDEKTRSSD